MVLVDFITDVLRQLGVVSEIGTPSAEQGADAVTKLNDLMASLEEDGIRLGFNPKASTADTIDLPDGQRITIKAMLGVLLCDGYGIAPPPVMTALADSGYKRLLRQSIQDSMRESVSDAPRGERNRYYWDITRGC